MDIKIEKTDDGYEALTEFFKLTLNTNIEFTDKVNPQELPENIKVLLTNLLSIGVGVYIKTHLLDEEQKEKVIGKLNSNLKMLWEKSLEPDISMRRHVKQIRDIMNLMRK